MKLSHTLMPFVFRRKKYQFIQHSTHGEVAAYDLNRSTEQSDMTSGFVPPVLRQFGTAGSLSYYVMNSFHEFALRKRKRLPSIETKKQRTFNRKEGSLMIRKMQDYIVKGKKVFIGLEDSKKSWKISVRSEGMEIHYLTMPAKYYVLKEYLTGNYPSCEITVIYEAGFKGFDLYDRLTLDGFNCVVTPPNKYTVPL